MARRDWVALGSLALAYGAAHLKPDSEGTAAMSKEELERLRALGYIQQAPGVRSGGGVRMLIWLAIGLAVGASARAEARDLPEVVRSGRLRVAAVVEEKEPEFLSLRPGGMPGFDREILEGFAHRQGVQIDFVVVPAWDGLIPVLLSGKSDLIAGRISDTPARRKQIDFTNE